jgi:hypothetical protein
MNHIELNINSDNSNNLINNDTNDLINNDTNDLINNETDDWTLDIEKVINRIRINSAILSTYHKNEYYKFKGYLKYFRIPTIVLSAIGSVTSVGFKPYLPQDSISITTCFIGLTVGILNSIELFLSIQSTMEKSLSNSKDFYLLSIDIKKTLLLYRDHRQITGKEYLDEKYMEYCKLIETSELINKNINDRLLPIEMGNSITKMIRKRKKKRQLNNKNNNNNINNNNNNNNKNSVEIDDTIVDVDNRNIENSDSDLINNSDVSSIEHV